MVGLEGINSGCQQKTHLARPSFPRPEYRLFRRRSAATGGPGGWHTRWGARWRGLRGRAAQRAGAEAAVARGRKRWRLVGPPTRARASPHFEVRTWRRRLAALRPGLAPRKRAQKAQAQGRRTRRARRALAAAAVRAAAAADRKRARSETTVQSQRAEKVREGDTRSVCGPHGKGGGTAARLRRPLEDAAGARGALRCVLGAHMLRKRRWGGTRRSTRPTRAARRRAKERGKKLRRQLESAGRGRIPAHILQAAHAHARRQRRPRRRRWAPPVPP